MTKSELRKLRKQARADGQVVEFENGRPVMVTPRTAKQERQHAVRMHRWAKRYDELNGAPEGDWDR